MPTLVLLGDSILDNAPYTHPEPDTTAHLKRLLPDWSVERLALDGATMAHIPYQLRELPKNVSCAILSVGGNDAVEHIDLLNQPASNSAEVLRALLEMSEDFAERYRKAASAVVEKVDRLVLCTIYEVQLEPKYYAQLARVPLALLNDIIVRTGSRLGADVLDLRSVCTDPRDFVLQIEPSARGAEKIAKAIAGVVKGDDRLRSARVFAQ